MEEKILRLLPEERQKKIEHFEIEVDSDLFINVYRKEYSDDLNGYFLRSKFGVVVIINNTLPTPIQAKTIKEIIRGAQNCPSSEIGLVKRDMVFRCGGRCCFGST